MTANEIIKVIDDHEQRYRRGMDEAALEDSRTYYSNQTAVLALEELKLKIKSMEDGASQKRPAP